MPELPEVETVVRSLAPLTGQRILTAEFRNLRILRGGHPDALSARLQGRRILAVRRYGKFIVASLEGGGYLTIHLGMTGRLLLGGTFGKHTHAIFTFDRATLLFDDSRQFGSIEFTEEFPRRVARLGPEPLEIPFDQFAIALRCHKTRIKSLLLNQTFLRGVGNIYADEALFRAGIHPGDIIYAVDGKIISVDGKNPAGLTSSDMVAKALKGPRGTHVQATMLREGQPKPLVFDLIRDEKASGWDARAKGPWNIESRNVVSHSSPLTYLSYYLLTGDEDFYRRFALPALEFMISRSGAHFAAEREIGSGYYQHQPMRGPMSRRS